jgi:probable phosphoglycerate mutase
MVGVLQRTLAVMDQRDVPVNGNYDRSEMSIILIRHGETLLNAARTLQPADTPLSERGVAQARAVAKRLSTLRIAGIVSSDLPRADATAQAIADVVGLAFSATPLLQERNFGDWRGRPYDSLGFNPLTSEDAPPGGESMGAFRQRVALAFAHLLQMRQTLPGPLVAVTHGLVIKALLNGHVPPLAGITFPDAFGNTSVTVLSERPPHDVDLAGCMRHLQNDSLRHDAKSLSGG